MPEKFEAQKLQREKNLTDINIMQCIYVAPARSGGGGRSEQEGRSEGTCSLLDSICQPLHYLQAGAPGPAVYEVTTEPRLTFTH